MDSIEAARTLLFNPATVIIQWDHGTEDRNIFGRMWGIPSEADTPLYKFWKMTEWPQTLFVSDNPANDSKQYVEDRARELGTTPQEVLDRAVGHEYAHRVITNPIADLLLTDTSFNWWAEAIAIMYTDYSNYQKLPVKFYQKSLATKV